MKKLVHRFGKFYSKVMMDFIGIFIFVGILAVMFGEHGWIPNKNIYAISQFGYSYVIPIMIAYTSGNQMVPAYHLRKTRRQHIAGEIAVMATVGALMANSQVGILGAMLIGPGCGYLWNRVIEPALNRWNTKMDMLIRNLTVAGIGSILTLLSYYVLTPFFVWMNQGLMTGMVYLVKHRFIFLLSSIIEPAKILFLNNCVNHGILIPLGIQQAEQMGDSILFLLESNPGPGFGVLLALYLMRKERRKDYMTSMFVQLIGGIHEVYFPEILSNLWLLFALVAGGTVGSLCFLALDVAAVAVVSPGSIISILLVCTKNRVVGACFGIFFSAVTSMLVAILILFLQKLIKERKKEEKQEKELDRGKTRKAEVRVIKKVGFICDAGVGSSAMGAALLRKKLKERDITNIEVAAYAADQIPADLDLAICQKNFRELVLADLEADAIFTVESLVSQIELSMIIEEISKRRDEQV